MRIRLLGTGAADGIPNPFCSCPTCSQARITGPIRARSSALVDERILVDPGPDVAQQTARMGIDLRSTRHWLITHGHDDHVEPLLVLMRDWVLPDEPLTIWGPLRALESLRLWLRPGGNVELVPCSPGTAHDLELAEGRYRITAHRADHCASAGFTDELAREALLWSIASEGHTFLYATDTGSRPSVDGGPFDCVAIDCTFGPKTDHGTGHLDFGSLPQLLTTWRADGVIGEHTRVLATHIGHHNPLVEELIDTLHTWRVEVPIDGSLIDLDGRERERTLVTGGMRSGKSHFAEERARRHSEVIYVATSRIDGDVEWAERIARHRARRPDNWETIETTDPRPVLRDADPGVCVLIDCISLWLTHLLDDLDAWNRLNEREQLIGDALSAIEGLCGAIRDTQASVICVTNEVGMTTVPIDASARLFTDLLGITNSLLAECFDSVYLTVAGRAMELPARIPGGMA